MDFKLLSRDQFRESVFKRDEYSCIVCKKPAQDAHHIIERRLFSNGGYYIENGSSLCGEHHLAAEQTILSCEEIRNLIGISNFPIPEHLYRDQIYDKWANPVLPNGMRLKGELFEDVSVQKILQPVLYLFTDRVKYPRTYHLPWSPGITKDERVQKDISCFENKQVVATVKLDGECTSLYSDYLHARSVEYEPHPSRSLIKSLHASIGYNIPKGWRVCGENLYAKHSIKYENLDDYFLVFSIWNEKNICLSWEETKEYSSLLNLKIVPILYEGIWDEKVIKNLYTEMYNGDLMEGYVVRIANQFHYKDFRTSCAKFVRNNHVQTHGSWVRNKVEPNGLKQIIKV